MYSDVVSTQARTAWLGLTAALMTVLPLLAFVIRFGVVAPLSLFQADAFYYLDITRASTGTPGFTFDRVHQTNGFHPLWQWLLSLARWLGFLNFADPARAAVQVYVLDVVLLSLAAALVTVFAARPLRFKALALLATAPGLLWFLACPITPGYLSTWSYANGMESALSLAVMAGALLLCPPGEASPARDICFSFALGLAVLARLDDVFFLLALAAWGLLTRRLPLGRWLLWVVPASGLLAAYLLYNRLEVGTFLPLSGMAKAGLAAGENLRWTGKLIVPMLTKNAPSALDRGTPDSFAPEAIRAFQMVVPPLLCGLELWAARLQRRSFGIVQALCAGVLLKGLYNFVLVAGHSQGLWYYTVSVTVTNLVLVEWLDRLATRLWPEMPSKRLWIPGYVLLGLYSFSALYGMVSTTTPYWVGRLLARSPALTGQLRRGGDTCFTEFDDGFTSYALDLRATAGLGLALDLQATEAARQGNLLPLLVQRGCSLLIASPVYGGAVQNYLETGAWRQGVNLFAISASEFRQYTLVPLVALDNTGLSYYRIHKLGSPNSAAVAGP